MKLLKEISLAVYERDNYKCVQCGSSEKIVPHHKVHRCKGGPDTLDNLVTLCLVCHEKEHPWIKRIRCPHRVYLRLPIGVVLVRESQEIPKALIRLKEQRDSVSGSKAFTQDIQIRRG